MKKVTLLLTIAIFVYMTGFLAYSKNNSCSYATFTINSYYGPKYNPPGITDKSATGTDYEGPLYSTSDTWIGYSDNGWTEGVTGGGLDYVDDYSTPPLPDWIRNKGIFESNAKWDVWKNKKGRLVGYWSWAGDYRKIFAASAYAYISCSSDNANYKTSYDLYAEVPSGFHIEPIRDPDTQIEYGSFSDNEFRDGSIDGWDHGSLVKTDPAANVSASGLNPSDESTHSTDSEAPTTSTAHDLYVYCDYCSDGCSICSDYR